MSRYHSYINSAKEIVSLYGGEEPLAAFLKNFFARYKKYGSKDRKVITHLCYCYYRLGNALPDIPIEEKMLMGLFLCSDESDKILEHLKPEWNENVALTLKEKRDFLDDQFLNQDVFLWKDELSAGIEKKIFTLSHFIQPDIFIRVRPGKEKLVIRKLEQENITYNVIPGSCIALPNSSKIDKILELNKDAVIQDYNSQQTGKFLRSIALDHLTRRLSVWDCCAASGGKSIMAKDILGEIDLTVSDVRPSILINLKKRFAEAGIKEYKMVKVDLSQPVLELEQQQFDIIIADVPCSGSGTWGRTPEQLSYFEEKKINEYANLQRKIIDNVITYLKPGGYLLYITCSVFKKENEDQANYIKQKFHLNEVKMEWLRGYDRKADTMFAVLLSLPMN